MLAASELGRLPHFKATSFAFSICVVQLRRITREVTSNADTRLHSARERTSLNTLHGYRSRELTPLANSIFELDPEDAKIRPVSARARNDYH